MIKQVRDNYAAPVIEKEIRDYWDSKDAYHKTKEARENGERFYFVDGPPYTSGHVHMGTALNKTIKDILIRYWRMNGYNVRDQPGFDMHGLPIEVQVEKKITVPGRVNKDGKPDEVGVRSKKEIEEIIGIDEFVNTCKEHALSLQGEMTEEFKELGVWMDWEHPYQTIKNDYIESAWWTIQKAHEKAAQQTAQDGNGNCQEAIHIAALLIEKRADYTADTANVHDAGNAKVQVAGLFR